MTDQHSSYKSLRWCTKINKYEVYMLTSWLIKETVALSTTTIANACSKCQIRKENNKEKKGYDIMMKIYPRTTMNQRNENDKE